MPMLPQRPMPGAAPIPGRQVPQIPPRAPLPPQRNIPLPQQQMPMMPAQIPGRPMAPAIPPASAAGMPQRNIPLPQQSLSAPGSQPDAQQVNPVELLRELGKLLKALGIAK